jgi:hypothetical protein
MQALLILAENTKHTKGIPPAGLVTAILKFEVDWASIGVLEYPGTVGLPLRSQEMDRFLQTWSGVVPTERKYSSARKTS